MNMLARRFVDQAHRIVGCTLISDAQPHGDSVRVRKLGEQGFENPPTAAYLVYIRLETGANLTVRHMFRDSLIGGSIGETEKALLASAQMAAGSPEQVGKDFETMLFQQPCYFTIVLDNDNWDFYFPDPESVPEPGAEAQDPIVFIASKSTLIEQPNGPAKPDSKTYDPNKSFYDAREVVVSGRNAVRCINFHRNEYGEPLKPRETQNLGFEILLRVPFSVSPTEDRKIVVIIDPDGQNQGPD